MLRSLLLPGTVVLLTAINCVGAPLYEVSFQANFNSGFGGLPQVMLTGSYTFELLPASRIGNDNTTAYYENHIRSASFQLNGTTFTGSSGYLRIDDNIPYGDKFRDLYASVIDLSGSFGPEIVMTAGGLEFGLVDLNPTAFTSLALPLTTSDLDGFTAPANRSAVLVFRNLSDGIHYASHTPVQLISITPVPEPSTFALVLAGFGIALLRMRGKSDSLRDQHRSLSHAPTFFFTSFNC